MTKHTLTPQARRAEESSKARNRNDARVETRQSDETLPLWQIAALVTAGIVLLALI